MRDYGMKTTRINRIASLFVAGLMTTGVASAQVVNQGLSPASNTYQNFTDSPLTRDSRLNDTLDILDDFYPSISVSFVDSSNVRRRDAANEESDSKWVISPALAYRSNIGRHPVYVAYSGSFSRYDEFDTEDADSTLLNARLGLDLSKRFDLNLFVGDGQSYEDRGISGSPSFERLLEIGDIERDEVDYRFYGADLVYGRKFSPLNVVVGFEKREVGYEDTSPSIDGVRFTSVNRDRESDSLHLDVSYKLGAQTSVFGRIEEVDIEYDNRASTLDSEESRWLLGVRWAPSSKLNGVLGVGNTEKDFVDPSREDFDGSTYYANLNYAIKPYSVVTLNVSKFVEEPSDAFTDYYESQLVGLSWTHSISDRLAMVLHGKKINDDYNTGREDDFTDLGIGLDYTFRRWLILGAYYGKIERDSNTPSIAYDEDYFGLKISSDLRFDRKENNQ
jgi:hypothetical protein